MKILFVADPLEKIKPKGDSTLVLVREACRRGHEVLWATDADIEYLVDHVAMHAWRVGKCERGELPELSSRARYRLSDLDAVFIRRDPPFDAEYVRLCWLLALAEKNVWMFNKPSLLLRYHEKLVPLEALAQGFLQASDIIPSHLGGHEEARQFVRNLGASQVITKPFLGFGGNGVNLLPSSEFLAAKGTSQLGPIEDVLVQPFEEDIIRYGDRRVFFLDGEILCDFVRRPKPGGFISNLAQGGSAVAEPLLPAQEAVLKRLGKFLKSAGIELAGADLIGTRISEVNITSPTGLRSMEQLEGNDYSSPIIDFAERSVAARTR